MEERSKAFVKFIVAHKRAFIGGGIAVWILAIILGVLIGSASADKTPKGNSKIAIDKVEEDERLLSRGVILTGRDNTPIEKIRLYNREKLNSEEINERLYPIESYSTIALPKSKEELFSKIDSKEESVEKGSSHKNISSSYSTQKESRASTMSSDKEDNSQIFTTLKEPKSRISRYKAQDDEQKKKSENSRNMPTLLNFEERSQSVLP